MKKISGEVIDITKRLEERKAKSKNSKPQNLNRNETNPDHGSLFGGINLGGRDLFRNYTVETFSQNPNESKGPSPEAIKTIEDIKNRQREFHNEYLRDREELENSLKNNRNIHSKKDDQPKSEPEKNDNKNLGTAAKLGIGAAATYGAYRVGKHLYGKYKQRKENNMEKVARSSNVKRKLRDASPKAVFDYEVSKGHDNKVQAEEGRRSALDENNVMRKDRFYTGNKRKIDFKNTGRPQPRPSEALGNTPQDTAAGNQFKQNVLARRGSRRIFADAMKNASPEDREGIAEIRHTRSELIRRQNQDFGHIQQTLGKKKLVGGDYKSPKEQWKSTNNPPKPKMNIYGKPLDPSAPKSTFTKKASDEGEETKGQKVKRYAKAALKGSAKGAVKGLGASIMTRGALQSAGATGAEIIVKDDPESRYKGGLFGGGIGAIMPKNRHVAAAGGLIGAAKALHNEHKKGKEMKKEAKSKNIGQRLMEASKSAREAYENSKKARTPKDFDPTKAVHEHHNYQYDKPKNVGNKPKIKSIDDFLNNTFY